MRAGSSSEHVWSPLSRRGLAIAVALIAAIVAVTPSHPDAAGGQGRSIVVVGDSVILGAESQMLGAFQSLGWAITFDAAVNRSTAAGADAVNGHGAALGDTLVINLGANDAGNPSVFAQRVDSLLSQVSLVPNVFWLTIREVRDYYPAANQALRDVAARYPNVTVLDWNAATLGRTDLTSSDGLHLNGAGAAAMTDLVTGAAVWGTTAPGAAPVPAPTSAPPPPTVVATTVAPSTVPPTTVPPTTVAPTTVPTTVAPTSSTTSTPRTTKEAPESALPSQVIAAPGDGGVGIPSWAIFALCILVIAAGAAGGRALGGRHRSEPVPPPDQ